MNKRTAAVCLAAIALSFAPAWAVSGYAVTCQARWTCYGDIAEKDFGQCWGGDGHDLPGKIVRYVIASDAVTACDTIYKQTYARYPVINIAGTKVAFYRYEARNQNNALVDMDKPRHISVMNIDGSGLVDLVNYTQTEAASYNELNIFLDWTAGDWIYYTKPALSGSDPRQVWKVQASNASTNQLVYTYQNVAVNRWNISANATRSTIQGSWAGYYTSIITDFPLTRTPATGTSAYPDVCCCNIACSPTGLLVSRFVDTGHQNVYRARWNAADFLSWSQDGSVSAADILTWAGKPTTNNQMGMNQFSSNSDRWYAVSIGKGREPKWGHNQLLASHVEQKAIMTTNNQPAGNITGTSEIISIASAGDFWVQGPTGSSNKIQNEAGEWIDIPGVTATDREPPTMLSRTGIMSIVSQPDGRLLLALPDVGMYQIERFSTNGACVSRMRASGQVVTIDKARTTTSVALLRVTSESTGLSHTMRVRAR